ncbi:MAG: hypothetical protein M1608_10950, partial [Candidatus Omnitrophica bacterium]|nr:hypothetical protein [Candidatus Omnitrophota bacterium]
RRGYWPVVNRIQQDNFYGGLVFGLHNIIFRSPLLSRVVYQAIITERKKHVKARRPLENILWKIASGDDLYRNIFLAMVSPPTIGSIISRGFLITVRNYLAECFFGLRWRSLGRFTTGVSKERLDAKRAEYGGVIRAAGLMRPARLEFERMYSIKIKAGRTAIAEAIGEFGESDRSYFTPNLIEVHRIDGHPNEPGCVIEYRAFGGWLRFSLVLETIVRQHYFLYRVRDSFARNGILIFEIEDDLERVSILSIYVAFDFYRGSVWTTRPLWTAFKCLFPAFVHDVLWNHSLCQLKDGVESNSPETRNLEITRQGP